MKNAQISLTKHDIPYKWSTNAADFINKVLNFAILDASV